MRKAHTIVRAESATLSDRQVLSELLLVAQRALLEHAETLRIERRCPNTIDLCMQWASHAYDMRIKYESKDLLSKSSR
jgi:hypothetical protein